MNIKIPIACMLFLEYSVWGAWYVTLGTYLGQTLKFDGVQIGLVYGAFGVAAMVSPLIVGVLVDYLFAAQKVLATLHAVGAVLLLLIVNSTEFSMLYLLVLGYALCYMPTIALTNSIAMRHLKDASTEFPQLRIMGTIGWIVIGWFVSALHLEASVYPVVVAILLSLLVVLNSFFLPNTPPLRQSEALDVSRLLGLDAIRLMKDRSFAAIIIASLLIAIPLSFYFGFANLFLNDVGVSYAAGKMTLGQISEIVFMLLLPVCFRRLGIKNILLIAMAAWCLRYLCFAIGAEGMFAPLLIGILLHGICYDFFFVAGQIYVDQSAPEHLKSSAQGLLAQVTYGLGMFIGTWLSGVVVAAFTTEAGYQWTYIWLAPAVFAFVVAIGFSLFFVPKKTL